MKGGDQTLGILKMITAEYGLEWKMMTPYQFRIDETLDIYPTNKKWHDLQMGTRGEYKSLLTFLLWYLSVPVAATCPKCKHNFFHNL